MPAGDLELAQAMSRQLGFRHVVLPTHELDNPDYARNPPDRCYYCKRDLLEAIAKLARELGIAQVVHGQNADDSRDLRPGARAALERGVRAPLAEVGMTKAEIRELARAWGIPVWNRPSAACLSSRIPYGTPVTVAALQQIDQVERYLRQEHGVTQVRCRHHGGTARLELADEDLNALLAAPARRQALVAQCVAAGYARATVDLRGFRSGSMNEVLAAGAGPAADAVPQLQQALAQTGNGRSTGTVEGAMLTIRVTGADFGRLATPGPRQGLVERAGRLGCRYLALDLVPLES
jgi:uncharacterized protein